MTTHCSMYVISMCFLILTAVQSEYSTSSELQFPDWTCTFFVEENLICVEHNHTLIPCIRNGYWLGDTGLRVNNQTIYGLQACTLGSCSEVCETCGNLPNMEWCKVPPIEPTLYCKEHRIAPICSQCQESYSLSYDSYSCVHFTTGKQVGLFLMFILYWVFLLSQVVFILKFNYRLGSGSIYGFLYYFSVVRYILWYDLPSYLDIMLDTFGMLARMDPLVLTYSGFCLYPEVTTLQYKALHYIHPVVVMLLVGLFIGAGRLCPRFVIFSGSVAVQVLCYIILLSYTSLAETSLNILNPMTYLKTYPQTETHFTFVEIQPQTRYMDHTEHLPYALVAIVVEVLIVIPFALFVLFAPCLIRWVNLVRIKPLLDEYQSCYKDNYRWFAGVYLLGRQIFFITSIWAFSMDVSMLLNQIFCILVLVLHATLQPYRKKWLNYVDTVFLLDLAILTLLYDNTGVNVLNWNSKLREAFITVLILIPCVYFLYLLFTNMVQIVYMNITRCCPLLVLKLCAIFTWKRDREISEFPPRLLEEESRYNWASNPRPTCRVVSAGENRRLIQH